MQAVPDTRPVGNLLRQNSDPISVELASCDSYLLHVRGLAITTRRQRVLIMYKFLLAQHWGKHFEVGGISVSRVRALEIPKTELRPISNENPLPINVVRLAFSSARCSANQLQLPSSPRHFPHFPVHSHQRRQFKPKAAFLCPLGQSARLITVWTMCDTFGCRAVTPARNCSNAVLSNSSRCRILV